MTLKKLRFTLFFQLVSMATFTLGNQLMRLQFASIYIHVCNIKKHSEHALYKILGFLRELILRLMVNCWCFSNVKCFSLTSWHLENYRFFKLRVFLHYTYSFLSLKYEKHITHKILLYWRKKPKQLPCTQWYFLNAWHQFVRTMRLSASRINITD